MEIKKNTCCVYILACSNGSYYTGSTKFLSIRLQQHQRGEGAKHTRRYGPVELVFVEYYARIDQAFYREKQIQRWSRKKKEALINGCIIDLKQYAICQNDTNAHARYLLSEEDRILQALRDDTE